MELNTLEYNALIKALSYLKFNCKDSESRYHAASPVVGEILGKSMVEFNDKLNKKISFELESSGPVYNLVISGVKANLERTLEWKDMDDESKKRHLYNLAAPYSLSEEQTALLLEYANEFHC